MGMKKLIKFDAYGGDADITYTGFFILTPELWDAFQELVHGFGPEMYEEPLTIDCEGYVSVSPKNAETFMKFFTASDITEDEFDFLKKNFHGEFESPTAITSMGQDAIWSWVLNTEEAIAKVGYTDGLD
jgi:hypothetical protein